MKAKSALVTGGAGFIGSHLVDRLLRDGFKVRVIDNFSTGRFENLKHLEENPRAEIIKGDLKNYSDALESVQDIDAVFHYAANPEVRLSTAHPRIHFKNNVLATFNLLEAMRKANVREMVFASSSSVYGEPEAIPVSEEAPIKPISVYGASKAACENLLRAYANLYGLRVIAIRYANVVGPRMRHGVIYDFIIKLRRNPHKLEILGDGTQIRSYIYIDDAIEATLLAFQRPNIELFEIYNIGNEDYVTVMDVANIVVKSMGLKDVEYIFKPIGQGVGWRGDVKKITISINKIKNLGFKTILQSAESVRKTALILQKDIYF